MSKRDNPEELLNRMEALRRNLHSDVADVSHNAKEMTDWRFYFRRFPWAAAGIAAAAGYAVVPKRKEIVSPTPETLSKLADEDKLVVKRKPKATSTETLAGTLLTLAATAASRAAVGYIGGKLAQVADPRTNPTSSVDDPSSNGRSGSRRRPSPR